MSQSLTNRNGVVCHWCFNTIDLTGMKGELSPHRKLTLRERMDRLMVPVDMIKIVCPFCNRQSSYNYEEVKPIAPSWEDQKQVYEARIKVLEAEKAQIQAEAKLLAKVAHENLPDEPETSTAIPSSSTMKPPTPPEDPMKKKAPYIG